MFSHPGKPRPPAPPLADRPISPEMARALSALAQHALQRFRVGYAEDRRGPFFLLGTLDGLCARGLAYFSGDRRLVAITPKGLAALRLWRREQSNTEAA